MKRAIHRSHSVRGRKSASGRHWGGVRNYWSGYRFTVEGTIHTHSSARGQGFGTELFKTLFERMPFRSTRRSREWIPRIQHLFDFSNASDLSESLTCGKWGTNSADFWMSYCFNIGLQRLPRCPHSWAAQDMCVRLGDSRSRTRGSGADEGVRPTGVTLGCAALPASQVQPLAPDFVHEHGALPVRACGKRHRVCHHATS